MGVLGIVGAGRAELALWVIVVRSRAARARRSIDCARVIGSRRQGGLTVRSAEAPAARPDFRDTNSQPWSGLRIEHGVTSRRLTAERTSDSKQARASAPKAKDNRWFATLSVIAAVAIVVGTSALGSGSRRTGPPSGPERPCGPTRRPPTGRAQSLPAGNRGAARATTPRWRLSLRQNPRRWPLHRSPGPA